MNIVWLPLAEDNLDQIYDYYFQYNAASAHKIVGIILESIALLRKHPTIGSVVPEFKEYPYTFRSLITYKGRYRVIYCHTDAVIYIYAVWDCRQNPENMPVY